MAERNHEASVWTLAKLLKDNYVDSALVREALSILCRAGDFDCGLVYEADSIQRLCLKEQYPDGAGPFPPDIPARDMVGQARTEQAVSGFCHIARGAERGPAETYLLDLLGAQTLVLAPVADQAGNIYGFAALINRAEHRALTAEEIQDLAVPCSILQRYLGLRMHERKHTQARVALENILDNTGIDIYVNDFENHDILYVNKSMAAPYGGREQFEGRKCWEVLFPGRSGPCEFCPEKNLIDQRGQPTKVYTWDYQRPFDGAWFRVFSAAFRWADGRLAHVVSSADITENKRNEAIIENLANYDQLTGLPNRRMLLLECERRIKTATEMDRGYLLFFDIDGFKAINDKFGHDAGDEFLVQLGKFFNSIPLLKDAIYRNGGDEFVAIIGGESVSKENVQNLTSFIHERFKHPWQLKKGSAMCSTSIGVACYPEDGINAEDLLQKADMSMYLAKRQGGGRMCFGNQLNEARDGL